MNGALQIAVYGKGGIGKSTVSANISYILAGMGKKVLQIGCDPKHDSTRLLLDGNEQTTVLDYMRKTPPYDRHLEDIVLNGVRGIRCVEAGGPEPGIGCAGRGILSTFETLKNLGVEGLDLDVKIYDVLGDVVCGGFAVPLRNEYADGVYLVTSGEFMSVYAANNILKGIRNFDKGTPRVAGIILNHRGMENEYDMVERFAEAVGLPIVARIPRSEYFAEAESAGKTVSELYPDSDSAKEFEKISSHILSIKNGETELLGSYPLDDAEMGRIAKGERVLGNRGMPNLLPEGCLACMKTTTGKKTTTKKKIINYCAAVGAVYGCMSVTDAVIIVHGPRSCAHIMYTLKVIAEIKRGHGTDFRSSNVHSTEMDDTISVFGGAGSLEQKIRDLILEGHKSFFIVTTCASGIIGDNAMDVVNAVSNEYPELYFRIIEADGNITGDMGEGYIASAEAMLDIVDNDVISEDMTVNTVAERYLFRRGRLPDKSTADLFSELGIRINCRFMYETSMDSMKNIKKGKFTFAASDESESKSIVRLFESKTGLRVEKETLPVGLRSYKEFHKKIGNLFGIENKAEEVCKQGERKYLSEVERLKKKLKGKRVIIENRFTPDMFWLLEILSDLDVEIVKIGMGPRHERKEGLDPRYDGLGIPYAEDYDILDLKSDVDKFKPDLILTDSGLTSLDAKIMSYSRPDVGLDGVLKFGRKLANMLLVPAVEGWRLEE
ncbi:MAG: nitrogenase component 1 [Candidatus Methanomethylophilaceae archaeon]|jgi:nitrogenase iron protein NifH